MDQNYFNETEITQGSIIYGMRSKKYPNIVTYGIIITAACDLAQAKADKIYYLPGIPVEDWVFSEVGFKRGLQNCIKNLENNLQNKCKRQNLDWDTIITFSQKEKKFVLEEICSGDKEKDDLKGLFDKYKQYLSNELTTEEKQEIIGKEKKSFHSYFADMTNGKNMQFIFIPAYACEEVTGIRYGIVVDLQELDFLSPENIDKLCKCEIDEKALDELDKEEYNKQFFILDDPGFSILQGRLSSPWREYTMQHFSNGFIRIGVDNIEKNEIEEMVEMIFTRGRVE